MPYKVFLNSVPKSGTNLLQKLLYLAGIPWSGKSIGGACGRYELIKRLTRGARIGETPLLVGLEMDAVVSPTWVRRIISNSEGYVTAHAAYSDELHSMLLDQGYQLLFMVRHPVASLLSWANYIAEPGYYWKDAQRHFSRLVLEERIRQMLHGVWIREGVYHHSFSEIMRRALRWVGKEGVHVVRYEDLVGSKGAGDDAIQQVTIASILDHLGIQRADLEYIRQNLYGGTHTFRRGKADRWKTAVSSEMQEEIQKKLAGIRQITALGYEW